MKVKIFPDRVKAFGETDQSDFYLITNSEYLESFVIEEADKYAGTNIIAFDEGDDFSDIIRERISERAHILTILPNCLLHSVKPETLGKRKLLIMACRSGRTALEGIEHFVRIGEKNNPEDQEAFAEAFFEKGQRAKSLKLVDHEYGTVAEFHHMDDNLEWHEQLGALNWGQQQVWPSGEIACFFVPLKIKQLDQRRFRINGQFTLRGLLIVQSGPPSFQLEDQLRIFEALSTIRDQPVIIDVKNGDVVDHRGTHPDCQPAVDMLSALFAVDSRYRRLYEVGFSMNSHVAPWPGNTAMNEVWGGEHGHIHLGLGMLPHTQYRMDVFCAGTGVLGKEEELIFGAPKQKKRMKRQRTGACPCAAF